MTKGGEIVTQVEILNYTEDTIYLKISVKDTGIGIKEEQLENIFDAFKQADGSTTRKYGGTGLGLNISQKIVTMMSSELKVKSEFGKGTAFSFAVSFIKGKKLDEKCRLNKNSSKFLLVDNNRTSQEVFKKISDSLSVECIIVSNLADALKAIVISKDISVIFTDLDQQESIDFKNKVRETYQSKNTPFMISLTSNVSPEKLRNIKELEYNSYLYKPLRLETLTKTVNSLFELQKEQRQTKIELEDTPAAPAKILLVEDNKVNQKVAHKILKKMGHIVTLADNGQEALEKFAKDTFELVLMDIQMPVLDGIKATEVIRSKDTTTPIIALTANAFQSDKKRCLAAGMNDFTTKPFNREKVSELISKYTKKASFLGIEKRIVVVEDDRTSAQVLKILIDQNLPHYNVKYVETGTEACTLIGSFAPNAIILDIKLPDINGVDVLKFMSKHEKYSKIKVILNSCLPNDHELIKEAHKYNIHANLNKTDDREHIIKTLKQL